MPGGKKLVTMTYTRTFARGCCVGELYLSQPNFFRRLCSKEKFFMFCYNFRELGSFSDTFKLLCLLLSHIQSSHLAICIFLCLFKSNIHVTIKAGKYP